MGSLKEKIKNNELALGTWLTIGNTSIAEILANTGFEWIAIDIEHTSISITKVEELIRIIELSNCTPLVRVGKNDELIIKRVLDAGAHGVIIPMINCELDAKKAVNSVYYPPKGTRGVGLGRAQKYGKSFSEYKEWLSKECLIIAQIEHKDGIENLEKILAVDGIDATIIGPYDLSASFGFPGEFDRSEVKDALKRYENVCSELKKIMGYHSVNPDISLLKDKIDSGYKFLAYGFDAIFLNSIIDKNLTKLKNM